MTRRAAAARTAPTKITRSPGVRRRDARATAQPSPSRKVKSAPARSKTATIDRFGRILIPKSLREAAGFLPGTEIDIVAEPRGVRLVAREGEEGALLREENGILVFVGKLLTDATDQVERDREARIRKLWGV